MATREIVVGVDKAGIKGALRRKFECSYCLGMGRKTALDQSLAYCSMCDGRGLVGATIDSLADFVSDLMEEASR